MRKLLYIFYGLLIGVMGTYIVMKKFQNRSTSESSHSIAYEIKRLNKLIVAEQNFSDVISHKSSWHIPGLESYFSFDKKVLLMVDAKVQATYDLNRMDVEIDSVNRTISINKIPELEIKTYPDFKFYDMDQSRFNTFKEDELNEIKDRAVKKIEDSIDKKQLENDAHDQLIQNLGEIYLLAKAYNWKIIDKTPYSKELSNKFH